MTLGIYSARVGHLTAGFGTQAQLAELHKENVKNLRGLEKVSQVHKGLTDLAWQFHSGSRDSKSEIALCHCGVHPLHRLLGSEIALCHCGVHPLHRLLGSGGRRREGFLDAHRRNIGTRRGEDTRAPRLVRFIAAFSRVIATLFASPGIDAWVSGSLKPINSRLKTIFGLELA